MKIEPRLVKHIPSWFPGGGFQIRLRAARGYLENAKSIPFERARAERVSIIRTPRQFYMLTRRKRAGTAKSSLIGDLLDDYEATDTIDPGHEHDLKMIGAVMHSGEIQICLQVVKTHKLSFLRDTIAGVETVIWFNIRVGLY